MQDDLLSPNSSPEKFIKSEYLEEYSNWRRSLHLGLNDLNTNVLILEQLNSFRFDLFTFIPERIFWRAVVNSLYETCIIQIARLVFDNNEFDQKRKQESISIVRLESKALEWAIDSMKDILRNQLSQEGYRPLLESLKDKIRVVRNKFIAHRNADYLLGNKEFAVVTVTDLKEIVVNANLCLQVLSFGIQLGFVAEMSTSSSVFQSHDLVSVLDLVAYDFLRRKVNANPDYWHYEYMNYPENERQILESYLQKFNLGTLNKPNQPS